MKKYKNIKISKMVTATKKQTKKYENFQNMTALKSTKIKKCQNVPEMTIPKKAKKENNVK